MGDGRRLFEEARASEAPPLPLLVACESGDVDRARQLLREGADVNLREDQGWSPLIMAAKEGHAELLSELLASGASPNPPDVSHTPLRGAAIFGRDVSADESEPTVLVLPRESAPAETLCDICTGLHPTPARGCC
jgi:hypothetical protein